MRGLSVWRDLIVAAVVSGACALLAAGLDLQETLFEHTRRWERVQLDELQVALLVFAICLVVLYARRLLQLGRALGENRRLSMRALHAQEDERKHLARELHDELGQYLNAIKLDAQALGGIAPDGPNGAPAHRIAQNTDHVYCVVTDMIRRLRPVGLDELGLVAALEACVGRWRATQPALAIQLRTHGNLEDLSESLNLAIYRVVQESVTNCIRHASAHKVQVDLRRQPDLGGQEFVVLTIADDGVGMDAAQGGIPGRGLEGMRERMNLVGGEFDLRSGRGTGVSIRATFPLQANET
jgi:two-component system, NarL family, sensor histidine kinase UhpB